MSELPAIPRFNTFRRSWLVLGMLVAAHVAFSAIYNPFGMVVGASPDWLMLLRVGVMFSQPILFGSWAAIGPPPATKRIPLAAASLALVEVASGFASMNTFDPEFLTITFSLFVTSTVVMFIIRRIARWQILASTDKESDATAVNQFSLKYLLVLTTICAALLGAARVLMSTSERPQPGNNVPELLVLIGLVMLAIFPAIIVPLVALFPRPTVKMFFMVPLIWFALAWLAVEAVVASQNQQRLQVIYDTAFLQLGAVTCGLLTTLVLRLAGFRLLRRNASQLNATHMQPIATSA